MSILIECKEPVPAGDLSCHATSIIAVMKENAQAHPTRRYAKNWANTCIVVDAYLQHSGRKAHWRYVWRINGIRAARDVVAAELVELVSLGLANARDMSFE